MAISLYDDQGRAIQLEEELGRGGEGRVFAVQGQPAIVAKVYHKPLVAQHAQKLSAMVGGATAQLIKIAAWPTHTLHSRRSGPIAGFIMPRVTNYQELHILHGPRSRLQHFPSAGWPFLVHTALNVARAFAAVHQHGHVIGDVNDRNLLVAKDAMVKFIDCDSFQIRSGKTVYRCEVGVPTHTAPELQGQSLREAIRTPNHDLFGLAVLIFQLLFMGRHPFAGIPLDPGELPLDKAIKEYRFAYGPTAWDRRIQPPPGAAPLDMLPPALSERFERSFSPQGAIIGRPKASDWVEQLTAFAANLRSCSRMASHSYFRGLATCPWCALESRSGLVLFTAQAAPPSGLDGTNVSSADIAGIIRWLESITSPGRAPDLPVPASIALTPSTRVTRLAAARRTRRRVSVGLAMAGLLLVILIWSSSGALALVASMIAWGIALAYGTYTPAEVNDIREQLRRELDRAALEWVGLRERWNLTGADQFDRDLSRLKQKANEYNNLSVERDARVRDAKETLRHNELQRYLQSYPITASRITGIGPKRARVLRAHGVRTAAEITPSVIHVPGIGTSLASSLQGWRQSLVNNFRPSTTTSAARAANAQIEREITKRRAQLQTELRQGQVSLQQQRVQILTERQTLRPKLDAALHAVRQAEVDLAAL